MADGTQSLRQPLVCDPLDDEDLMTCKECQGLFVELNEHRVCEGCEDAYGRDWGGFDARREWGTY